MQELQTVPAIDSIQADTWMYLSEAAAYWRVAQNDIRRWIRQRKLTAEKGCATLLVHKTSMLQFESRYAWELAVAQRLQREHVRIAEIRATQLQFDL